MTEPSNYDFFTFFPPHDRGSRQRYHRASHQWYHPAPRGTVRQYEVSISKLLHTIIALEQSARGLPNLILLWGLGRFRQGAAEREKRRCADAESPSLTQQQPRPRTFLENGKRKTQVHHGASSPLLFEPSGDSFVRRASTRRCFSLSPIVDDVYCM